MRNTTEQLKGRSFEYKKPDHKQCMLYKFIIENSRKYKVINNDRKLMCFFFLEKEKWRQKMMQNTDSIFWKSIGHKISNKKLTTLKRRRKEERKNTFNREKRCQLYL